MHTDIPQRLRVIYGMIGLALLGGFAVIAVSYGSGFYLDGYILKLHLARSAQGLDTKSDVKVRGVTVGTVNTINLNPDGTTTLNLFMKPGTEISKTATVTVEPLSIFGPKFVKIDQGKGEGSGATYRPDETIPIEATMPNTEFTEVIGNATKLLRTIDPQEIITIIRSVADGVAGLGPAFATTVDNATNITDHLQANIPTFEQLLPNLASLANTLADNADNLVATATNLHQVLPDLTSRTDQVSLLLDGVMSLSAQLTPLLQQHQGSLDADLVALERIVGGVHAQLGQVPDLLHALDLFFGRLGGVLRYPHGDNLIGTIHAVLMPQPTNSINPLCRLIAGGGICPDVPEYPG